MFVLKLYMPPCQVHARTLCIIPYIGVRGVSSFVVLSSCFANAYSSDINNVTVTYGSNNKRPS